MSRTYRNRLPGYAPGERYHEAARTNTSPVDGSEYHHRDYRPKYRFERDHWMHGRDSYGAKIAIGEPNNRCPKGYGWDEVWGLHGKRSAKKAVSRIHRNRAKEIIRGYMKEGSSDSSF